MDPLVAELKQQYHSTLAMLTSTIEGCPEQFWSKQFAGVPFWREAYHALFWMHNFLGAQDKRFCNAVYQPTLKLVDPKRYAAQEEAFVEILHRDRTGGTRWKQHPFYYTVLALDEIGTDATKAELRHVAHRVQPSLLKRYQGKTDRSSRFRRLAIETALKYA